MLIAGSGVGTMLRPLVPNMCHYFIRLSWALWKPFRKWAKRLIVYYASTALMSSATQWVGLESLCLVNYTLQLQCILLQHSIERLQHKFHATRYFPLLAQTAHWKGMILLWYYDIILLTHCNFNAFYNATSYNIESLLHIFFFWSLHSYRAQIAHWEGMLVVKDY